VIFHLVAITGDGPALGKLACTSFATNGANCRCCVDNRASKFILNEGEEPNKKREDVNHIRVMKGLRSFYEEKLRFNVQAFLAGRPNRIWRKTEEEKLLKADATALGLRKLGSKMRLSSLFDEQRSRKLNEFYDSMPCDIVHVFEGGVFKKILEVVLQFLETFAGVSCLIFNVALFQCCLICCLF
jgi:hypothetical protein